MKILNRIYLISAILFTALCIALCVHWSLLFSFSPVYLIIFLPTVTLWIAYFACSNSRHYWSHAAAIILSLLAMGFCGFLAFGIERFLDATAEITAVRRYSNILEERWKSEERLVKHFPRPIPADAQEVRFSFAPAFLQGGAYIQLRCRMSADSILELYDRFSQIKTRSYFGGDTNDHMNMKEGMPTTFFYTSGSEERTFPEDYEIMIFDPILKEKDRPAEYCWNHGQCHGVAISKKNNEIVYWAESW